MQENVSTFRNWYTTKKKKAPNIKDLITLTLDQSRRVKSNAIEEKQAETQKEAFWG